jgi:hypothetical protein
MNMDKRRANSMKKWPVARKDDMKLNISNLAFIPDVYPLFVKGLGVPLHSPGSGLSPAGALTTVV